MKQVAAIGIDFGVSKVHTNIISLQSGELLAEHEVSYRWDVLEDDRGEIDPEKIWNCAQDSLEELLKKNMSQDCEYRALSFSCFGDVFVAVDQAGNAVYPMLLFSDLRAESVMREFEEELKATNYSAITGGPIHPGYVLSKIYWMKKETPEIYEKSAGFWSIQQYVLCKLGLEAVSDYSMAARKMMFNVQTQEWSADILSVLEKDKECFGNVYPAATVIGKISTFGRVSLPNEVEVVLGAHDALCGFMGLGIVPNSNRALLANNAGTYNLVGTVSVNHHIFDDCSVTPGCGPIKNSYHYQAGGMIGPTLDWVVNNICHSSIVDCFQKARFDGNCKVRMLRDPMSGNGVFSGIGMSDTTDDIFTGFIESITLPIRNWAQEIGKISSDGHFDRMRIGAGGAKSDKWIQLKADLLDLPVERVQNLQTSSVGIAVIAAVAIGLFKDYGEAIDTMVKVEKTYYPDKNVSAVYGERFMEFEATVNQ